MIVFGLPFMIFQLILLCGCTKCCHCCDKRQRDLAYAQQKAYYGGKNGGVPQVTVQVNNSKSNTTIQIKQDPAPPQNKIAPLQQDPVQMPPMQPAPMPMSVNVMQPGGQMMQQPGSQMMQQPGGQMMQQPGGQMMMPPGMGMGMGMAHPQMAMGQQPVMMQGMPMGQPVMMPIPGQAPMNGIMPPPG